MGPEMSSCDGYVRFRSRKTTIDYEPHTEDTDDVVKNRASLRLQSQRCSPQNAFSQPTVAMRQVSLKVSIRSLLRANIWLTIVWAPPFCDSHFHPDSHGHKHQHDCDQYSAHRDEYWTSGIRIDCVWDYSWRRLGCWHPQELCGRT